MKYFKCGNCQESYKIDETKILSTQVIVSCIKCGVKNAINFEIHLLAQNKDKSLKLNLKEGPNFIGRLSNSSDADLLIEDGYVSRKHAIIHLEKKEGKVIVSIEDHNSLNGTFNKNKVRLKSGLKYSFIVGDYFIIGLTKISLIIN